MLFWAIWNPLQPPISFHYLPSQSNIFGHDSITAWSSEWTTNKMLQMSIAFWGNSSFITSSNTDHTNWRSNSSPEGCHIYLSDKCFFPFFFSNPSPFLICDLSTILIYFSTCWSYIVDLALRIHGGWQKIYKLFITTLNCVCNLRKRLPRVPMDACIRVFLIGPIFCLYIHHTSLSYCSHLKAQTKMDPSMEWAIIRLVLTNEKKSEIIHCLGGGISFLKAKTERSFFLRIRVTQTSNCYLIKDMSFFSFVDISHLHGFIWLNVLHF